MIDAVGGVIAVDDAVTVVVGGDAAGHGAGRGWRRGGDLFLVRAGGEQQRGGACQHEGLETHHSLPWKTARTKAGVGQTRRARRMFPRAAVDSGEWWLLSDDRWNDGDVLCRDRVLAAARRGFEKALFQPPDPHRAVDRKSTRLHSSH